MVMLKFDVRRFGFIGGAIVVPTHQRTWNVT